MKGIAGWFVLSAVVWGIIGLILGNVMAASHDHTQRPTHAHIMVIGWVSFFMFGIFYHLFGDVARRLAQAHFWLAQVSFLILAISLYLLYNGHTGVEPIASVGALLYSISFVIFGLVALSVTRAAQ